MMSKLELNSDHLRNIEAVTSMMYADKTRANLDNLMFRFYDLSLWRNYANKRLTIGRKRTGWSLVCISIDVICAAVCLVILFMKSIAWSDWINAAMALTGVGASYCAKVTARSRFLISTDKCQQFF